jgi:hypothetical protein
MIIAPRTSKELKINSIDFSQNASDLGTQLKYYGYEIKNKNYLEVLEIFRKYSSQFCELGILTKSDFKKIYPKYLRCVDNYIGK